MTASWSLRRKISGSVAIALVVIGCAVSYLSYRASMQAMEQDVRAQVRGIGSSFSKYVSDWFAAKGKTLEAFPADASNSELQAHLTQLKISANVDNSFLAFADGQLKNANQLTMAKGNDDPRVWGWYIHALAQPGKTYIADPSVASATGKNVVSLGRTVQRTDGSVVAVLGLDVVIDDIVSQLKQLRLPGDGYMLLSRGDTIFAHADQPLLNQPLHQLLPGLSKEQARRADIAANQAVLLADKQGNAWQLFSTPIAGTDLQLLMLLKRDALTAPVYQTLSLQLGAILVLVALAIVALNQLIGRLLAPLNRVSQALADIAQGESDLSKRLPVLGNDEVGVLANNFNGFLDHLADLVLHIRAQAGDLQQQALTMAATARQSVTELQGQQQRIEAVSGAMNEMQQASLHISQHAGRTAESVQSSVATAQQGRAEVERTRDSISHLLEQVQHASDVVASLNQGVQGISGILATIQGIAEQTNLLALNAAIEAARAGEQGRGFAVVADEVRVLSQRTAQSTGEIQTMINGLQSTAASAVHLMQQSRELASGTVANADSAASALQSIDAAIRDINQMAGQIATAAGQQSHVVHAVVGHVASFQQVAQDTAQGASIGEHHAGALKQLSDALQQRMASFRLERRA